MSNQASRSTPRGWRMVLILGLAAGLASCVAAGTGAGGDADPLCAAIKDLRGPARGEALAIARLLAIRPSIAIDFSDTTGEYCLNTGSHVMAHFAENPAEASEDIIYMVDADPLVARGLRFEEFPALDTDSGKRQPNTWYRYEGKGVEPHHGREMGDRRWLVLAIDVK